MFQGLVFIENLQQWGCQGEGRPTALVEGEWREISHSSCHSKAWFKAWLGMASSMARYGSLIDQAHHVEHMEACIFGLHAAMRRKEEV